MATKKTKKLVEDMKEVVEDMKEVVEEAKETAEVVADKIVEETKEVVKKAKKATAKKEMKTTLFVEYYGKQVQVEEKAIVASVKKAWTKNSGKKIGDINTMELYLKPEEAAVYYVINGTESGKVEF